MRWNANAVARASHRRILSAAKPDKSDDVSKPGPDVATVTKAVKPADKD